MKKSIFDGKCTCGRVDVWAFGLPPPLLPRNIWSKLRAILVNVKWFFFLSSINGSNHDLFAPVWLTLSLVRSFDRTFLPSSRSQPFTVAHSMFVIINGIADSIRIIRMEHTDSIKTVQCLYIYGNVLQIDSAYYLCDNTAFDEYFMFILKFFFNI